MKPWQEMEGLTTPEACEHLAALGMTVPADQAIVEVGVYRGRSLAALATYAGAEVHGIDPFNLPRPSKEKYSSDETYDVVRKNLEGYDVHLHRAYGHEVAKRWTTPKVGLLYIDADHRELPVLADFSDWALHLAPNAIVGFDDCDLKTFPGVVRAVRKLSQLGRIRDVQMMTDRLAVGRFVQ